MRSPRPRAEINAGMTQSTAITDGKAQGQAAFRANAGTLNFGTSSSGAEHPDRPERPEPDGKSHLHDDGPGPVRTHVRHGQHAGERSDVLEFDHHALLPIHLPRRHPPDRCRSAVRRPTSTVWWPTRASNAPSRATIPTTGTCATVRKAGATMITILAPYPAIPASQDPDTQYRTLVAPLASQLASSMLSCASGPTWAYKATDGPGINSAVQAILQQVLAGVTRLTH